MLTASRGGRRLTSLKAPTKITQTAQSRAEMCDDSGDSMYCGEVAGSGYKCLRRREPSRVTNTLIQGKTRHFFPVYSPADDVCANCPARRWIHGGVHSARYSHNNIVVFTLPKGRERGGVLREMGLCVRWFKYEGYGDAREFSFSKFYAENTKRISTI